MNSTTNRAIPRARKKGRVGLRHVSSLLGGALLGTSIMTPILAGGDTVDGTASVLLLSGVLALLGIGAHVAGSASRVHVVASVNVVAKTVATPSPAFHRCALARADSSLIV